MYFGNSRRWFAVLSIVCFAGSYSVGDEAANMPVDDSLTVAKTAPQLAVPVASDPATAPSPAILLVAGEATIAEATTGAALQEKQDEVASQLRVAMMQEKATQAASVDTAQQPQAKESQVDLLKQIDVIIAQQKSATATYEDIQQKQNQLSAQLSALTSDGLAEEPPYTITFYDQLRDSYNNSKAMKEALEESLLAAREAVERARLAIEDRKKAYRQVKEKATSPDDAALKAAELEVQLSEEVLVLKRQELAVEEINEAVRSLQFKIDELKINLVSKAIAFTSETLNEQLAQIDAREIELKRNAESLQSDLHDAERRWLAARQEVDSAATPGPEMIARVDALKIAQQTLQLELSVVNQRLQRIPMTRTAWERRYLVASGKASREDRRNWLVEINKSLDQMTRERRFRELKLGEARATLASVDGSVDASTASDPQMKRWSDSKKESLNKQIEIYNSSILAIDSVARVLTRLQLQIQGEKGRTVSEYIAEAWVSIKRFWNTELTNQGDISLTVGKVLSSVLLLFFGFFAARWLSRLLGRRLPKLGVDEAGANAIESLSFYALLIAFGLTALRYANVPLTVFTFLGGAIAIGVGFGSQNILNNFISGLILMAERPIKVGDLISIDLTYGNVTKIGARSTQIRTGENLDIIVPNSKFLENNVINLTRRDDRLRTSINVGVAYGSPLELVIKLLEQSAADHPGVNARPKPFVWFNDFGDNSLMFQLHFWVNCRTVTQMRMIETVVRLNIDRLFRENDIVIAFPQRDLHIQSPQPLEFRLVGDENAGLRAAS